MNPLASLRRSLRRLRQAPSFTTVATATVALATAVLGTVAAIGKALFVDALPYPAADRLLVVTGERRGSEVEPWPLGVLDLEDLDRRVAGLRGPVPVAGGRALAVRVGDAVEHFDAELVGAGYFELYGLSPAAGRFFTAEEARQRDVGAVVLGHGAWQRHFGGDPAAVGRVIRVNDRNAQVVGVAPAGFHGLDDAAAVWLPIGSAAALYQPGYLEVRKFRWLAGLARLEDGVALATVAEQTDAAMAALGREHPDDYEELHVVFAPLPSYYFADLRRPVGILLAAGALVLVVACSNLAMLVLVRGLGRRRQVSLQRALGARTRALLGSAASEIALVVATGGAIGLAAAHHVAPALLGSAGVDLPRYVRGGVDATVAAATLAACLLAGLLFAAAPAWHAAAVDPATVLRESARGGSLGGGRRRLLGTLVALQSALAVLLLAGAGLLVRGLLHHLDQELGLRGEGVTVMRVALSGDRYAEEARYVAFAEDLVARAAALPAVTHATLEGPGYPTYGSFGLHFHNDQVPGGPETWMTLKHQVTPGYFETLGIPLVEGRGFTAADRGEAGRVVVVSRELARQLWPGQPAVGKTLRLAQGLDIPLRVVGVAADVRHEGLSRDSFEAPDVYLSLLAFPPRTPPVVNLLVRGGGSVTAVAAGLRSALAAADPNTPAVEVLTLTEALRGQSARDRLLVTIMSGFALVTALLAAIGIYGAVSHAVEQTSHDMGVRLALGGTTARVAVAVARGGLLPVLAGTAAGLLATPLLRGVVEAQLHGLGPFDPPALGGAVAVLLLVAAAAVAAPTLRAARTDARDVLR